MVPTLASALYIYSLLVAVTMNVVINVDIATDKQTVPPIVV